MTPKAYAEHTLADTLAQCAVYDAFAEGQPQGRGTIVLIDRPAAANKTLRDVVPLLGHELAHLGQFATYRGLLGKWERLAERIDLVQHWETRTIAKPCSS